MNRRRFSILLGASLLCWLLWNATRNAKYPDIPQYRGKPLAHWLSNFEQEFATYGESTGFDNAIRQVGDKAVPVLLHMLREHRPVRDKACALLKKQHVIKIVHERTHFRNHLAARGFEVLGAAGKDAVPSLIHILKENISPDSCAATASALGNIGPSAEEAIPSLLTLLSGKGPYEKAWACYALAKIHRKLDEVVPALMKSATDQDPNVRMAAITALGQLGTDSKLAIPVLIASIKDSHKGVKNAAAKAILKIDFVTAEEIGLTTNGWTRQ
jgi:HEAT repeat protein